MIHAGIYIHIPFCRSRCSYCDFATGMYESALAERYVRAVISEIDNWREINNLRRIDTIYFGGGTPSLLSPAQIELILKAVRSHFEVVENPEVTLEINPGDGGTSPASKDQNFRRVRDLGVNRASFGAQTFDDRELK